MVNMNIEETSGVDHPAHMDEGWILMKNSGLNTEDFETIEKMVALESELADAQARLASLETEETTEETTEDMDYMDDDAMMKSAPPAVREALLKARNEAFVAQEELRKEREVRLDAHAIAKSMDDYGNLAIDHEEFGPALRRLEELDATVVEIIAKALQSANAQAESANIFAEIGSSYMPNTAGSFQKIESLAKSAVTKGEYKTVEQAIAGLIETNPSLYAEYIAETR
jgi:chemotaxis protein histidine kinase CheA